MDAFYEKIRKMTEEGKKKKTEEKSEITPEEDARLDYWVEDMAQHVEKRAAKGKTEFSYDCSNIREQLFVALCGRFKKKYPGFFVLRDGGRRWITIKWSGNYEV